MPPSRAAITGVGVVSPIGNDRETFWRACLEGRSGAVRLDSPWVRDTALETQIAAPVKAFDPVAAGIPPKLSGITDVTAQFALAAADEALRHAGFALREREGTKAQLAVEGVDPKRLGAFVGSGIGGLATLEQSHGQWRELRKKTPIKRYSLPMLIPNAPAGQVAIRFGAKAECKSISTACAAGTMSIGDAWRALRDDAADVILAGGAEGVVSDEDAYGLLGFERLRTLSRRNDEPERASRPFDLDRDGFVMGEGSAILVLEREEFARARGAEVLAYIDGYHTNCDAHSMMQLDESGASIVDLIRGALKSAGIADDDVNHISAHGTSTKLNDRVESMALRLLFGARCDEIGVTALKSMTGHAIGGSGPLEAAALALSLRHGVMTPTINYETPDPECNVDVVANKPRESPLKAALKLSYGFGGHNACLVLTPP